MTSTVVYDGNLRTVCTHHQSGTIIETDAPVDNQGNGERFSPTDIVSTALGFANEGEQLRQCYVYGENCHTAFGRTDFGDNAVGISCPSKVTCEERCENVPKRDKLPHEYGPFFGWPGLF